ncbi:PI-PLC X domain-containing protein 3-like protein [Dinothrombium tinctorium]|uniref:PI-PLC X domain-containing protein 3-like protein n=1 Tax=Dinothrombium tinctorium TaxID=1965070 RepID=A0A3S3PC49_9ACAR|nr:PI-PLC X domain-containing protein 3-like protein [Dinothrombium tinctorium]
MVQKSHQKMKFIYIDSAEVWITISSNLKKVNGKTVDRLLVLNWRNVDISGLDRIGLYNNEIGNNIEVSKAIVSIKPTAKEGSFRTEQNFPLHYFNKTNLSSECLGFYIAYSHGNHLIAKNCIKAHPFWMQESYEFIKRKSLRNLMLPGTHNSGSYFEGYKKRFVYNLIDKYTICQDENVFNQLAYGIR